MKIFIEIFCFIWPSARPESGTYKVAEYLLGGLAVALEHGEEEERQHQADHQDNGDIVADGRMGEQIRWHAHDGGKGKTDQLPLC